MSDVLISLIQDYIKPYGATGDYTMRSVNNRKVLYFTNPGWSINRTIDIRKSLYDYLIKSYGDLDDIIILFE